MANVNLKKDFVNGEKLYDYQLNNNFAAIEAALAAMNKIVWQDDEENGASVSAYKGDTDTIEDRELIDGQLLYNTETGETYIDTYVGDELKRINTGSGNVVAIQDTEPTNDAVKLWIETDTIDALDSEIVNEYSESTGVGYSADYMNDKLDEIIDTIYDAEVYSTDEVKTNKVWIDGNPIYRKIIEIGALPNSTTSQYAHNITNIDVTINCYGVVSKEDDSVVFTMPMNGITLWFDRTYISIITDTNRSAYNGKVIIEYTKVESEES